MSLDNVTPGTKVPDAFNVIIEIPMNADPIKYEVDKETGAIFVDRFMSTAMHYPTNYGYIPKTISGDGDPVDVLVITPVPLIPGVVVTCRALGMLRMEDEAGEDAKLLAVPVDKILSIYSQWQKPEDLNPLRLKTIQHFFEHYKDLRSSTGSPTTKKPRSRADRVGADAPYAPYAPPAGGTASRSTGNWSRLTVLRTGPQVCPPGMTCRRRAFRDPQVIPPGPTVTVPWASNWVSTGPPSSLPTSPYR